MSDNLTAIEDLAANYPPSSTYQLSGTSYAVLLYAEAYLSSREFWVNRNNPLDEISDTEWDDLQAYIDNAYRELMLPVIGQVIAYVTADPPTNVLPCDGSQYLRTDYPELYAILDSAFIVDADHFAVPDLMGRVIVGAGSGSGLTARAVDDSGGLESVELTTGTLPSHSHSSVNHSHSDTGHTHAYVPAVASLVTSGELPIPIGAAIPGVASTGVGFSSISSENVTINATGDGDPHENMQPFTVLNYGLIAR